MYTWTQLGPLRLCVAQDRGTLRDIVLVAYAPGGAMGVKKEETWISVELGYQCGIFWVEYLMSFEGR